MKKFASALLFLGLSLFWSIPPTAVAAPGKASAYANFSSGTNKTYYGFGDYHYHISEIYCPGCPENTADGWATLTGGSKPKIYLCGSITRSAGISCNASINWKFVLKKIYPPAPDDIDIPIRINYSLEVFATPIPPQKYPGSCYAIAAINYIQQGIDWWDFSLNTQNKNPDSRKASYYSSVRLLEQQELTITTITDTNCGWDPGQPFEGSLIAYAKIDPEVIIDPTFTVNINGVNYPANQLYGVELSPNLFSSPAPWLDLLLGD